jgi:hypothetical protein
MARKATWVRKRVRLLHQFVGADHAQTAVFFLSSR